MDLYRGKAKMTGDWIIGAAVVIGEKAHILGSESIFPERPAYHGMSVGAGLEDACITDRYEAAAYGWTESLERYEENFPKWLELEPETVTRCTGRHDKSNNVLFEGDVIKAESGRLFEICYGTYFTYDPDSDGYIESVGFFKVTHNPQLPPGKFDFPDIRPLGKTESYATLVGNIFDNPELRQSAGEESGHDAAQPLLMPAT